MTPPDGQWQSSQVLSQILGAVISTTLYSIIIWRAQNVGTFSLCRALAFIVCRESATIII